MILKNRQCCKRRNFRKIAWAMERYTHRQSDIGFFSCAIISFALRARNNGTKDIRFSSIKNFPDSTVSSFIRLLSQVYWDHAYRFKGNVRFFGFYFGLMSVFWSFPFNIENVSKLIKDRKWDRIFYPSC